MKLVNIAICILLYLFIVIFEVIPLIKSKKKKTLLIYIPTLLFTLTINILFAMGVNIPSPANPIKDAVTLIFGIK